MSLRSKVCHTGPYRHTEIISVRYGTRYRAVCTVHTARRRVWGISALGPAGKNKDAVDSPLNGQSIRETKLKLGIKIRDTDHREIERERRLSALSSSRPRRPCRSGPLLPQAGDKRR
ncbi:hypothetical protein B296_00019121 [Ensete ventricosum]|uniref:Uncharacterized protein n=1 Tax=Ensete ventricosum TaxID=4639 RepID=A0A426Z7Z4_ENSVE|nr:hypothetical protein B296_00019121 [Ensete ventricosum]